MHRDDTGQMLNVVLFEPEIPPNTGNIIRLCANTGTRLHLIEPLGFSLDDRRLRRAGLDYREWVCVQRYPDLSSCLQVLAGSRVFAFTTKARRSSFAVEYRAGDSLLFGPETRGLPAAVLTLFSEQQRIRIPMLPESRSLNLSNAVAVAVYEAWRQINGFSQPLTTSD